MTPLTANFVKQIVVACNMRQSPYLDPAELRELAEVWLTFQKVMAAIVQPDQVRESVADLYKELTAPLNPSSAPAESARLDQPKLPSPVKPPSIR